MIGPAEINKTVNGSVTAITFRSPCVPTSLLNVIVGRHDYLPFGPELTGTTINEPKLQDLKFTGHERDEVRDRPPLAYMHARCYQPRLGQFLSQASRRSRRSWESLQGFSYHSRLMR
jgi:RHS repeat-associated protein